MKKHLYLTAANYRFKTEKRCLIDKCYKNLERMNLFIVVYKIILFLLEFIRLNYSGDGECGILNLLVYIYYLLPQISWIKLSVS